MKPGCPITTLGMPLHTSSVDLLLLVICCADIPHEMAHQFKMGCQFCHHGLEREWEGGGRMPPSFSCALCTKLIPVAFAGAPPALVRKCMLCPECLRRFCSACEYPQHLPVCCATRRASTRPVFLQACGTLNLSSCATRDLPFLCM